MKNLFTILILLSTLVNAKSIKVQEHEYFTKGFRVLVNVSIKDNKGIYEARTYFKNSVLQNYQVYIPMKKFGNRYLAELPLTDIGLQKLDFVVVYQNSSGEVFKSDSYTMEKRDMIELPYWQTLNTKELCLYTEYAKPMHSIRGFKDRFTIKKSKDDALGVEAGFYTMEMINPKEKIDCSLCVVPKKNEIILDIEEELWE